MKKLALAFALIFASLFSFGQTAQEKAKIKALFVKQAKEMNQQCPMYLDELTTLTSVVFSNWVTTFSYKLNMPGKEVTPELSKEFVSEMKQQTKRFVKDGASKGIFETSQKDRRWFMKITGFKYKYIYYGNDGCPIGSFTLSYLDM